MGFNRSMTDPNGIIRAFALGGEVDPPLLKKASAVRFYLSGNSHVLAVKMDSPNDGAFFLPPNSRIPISGNGNPWTELSAKSAVIFEEMVKLGIPEGSWFLWDLSKDIILTHESFIEYSPKSRIGEALFILEFVNEELEEVVYSPAFYLSDGGDWTSMVFVMSLMAKNELFRPNVETTQGKVWTVTGRKVLSYLVSSFYNISAHFGDPNNYHLSSSAVLDFSDGRDIFPEDKPSYRRLIEIGKDTKLKEIASDLHFPKSEDKDDGITYLSELIEKGTSVFPLNGDDLVRIHIDMLQNVYRKIVYDKITGMFLVELHVGSRSMAKAEIAEELGIDETLINFGVVEG